jgi:hypothetical protein
VSSSVTVAPDVLACAATDVAGVGSSLAEANAAATAKTTAVVAAAWDEVSAAIALLFSGYGQEFQALHAQAARFSAQFAQALDSAGKAYATAETMALSSLKSTLGEAVAAATPNLSISVSGLKLVQLGSAKALAPLGGPNIAIAFGASSTAAVYGITGDVAIAAGSHSYAEVDGGSFALANGPNASAKAVGGSRNVAIASGEASQAEASPSKGGGRDLAIAVGNTNYAKATGREGNVAAALGGNYNSAYAGVLSGGSHDVAILDGENLWGAEASADGNGVVTIVPEGAEPNLAISVDGMNVVELGNAHAQSAGRGAVAIAFGDESRAVSLGSNSDIAIAFGTATHASVDGQGDTAFAFGNHDTVEVQDVGNFAGVLSGDQNTAIASGFGPHFALVLEGNNQVANASGQVGVDIVPSLGRTLRG